MEMIELPTFDYAVSRRYPYPWFSWVVIIGGICAAALFSVLNLAANGYDFDVQYRTDYNSTLKQRHWSQRLPLSIGNRIVPQCQPQNVAVNSEFFTNNLALEYTLSSVFQHSSYRTGINSTTLPSLKYAENPFENCTVQFVEIDLESSQRTAAQQGWTIWGAKALAQATCSINNDKDPTWFNLTASYEFVPPTIETGKAFSFLQNDYDVGSSSLWWGQALLSWNWLSLVTAMEKHADDRDDQTIIQGSIVFKRRTPDINDMTSLDFFDNPEYHFVTSHHEENGDLWKTPQCCITRWPPLNYSGTIANLAQHNRTPNIWLEADSFAKSFYASILADLGQNSTDNLLANPTALEYFTANLTSTIEGQDSSINEVWLATDPATKRYSETEQHRALGIGPAVIYAQYLCQIPKLKSTGSLIISILIADLVFLQALWSLAKWLAIAWLHRRDPHANYCEGCRKSDQLALSTVRTDSMATTRSTPYLPMPPGTLHSRSESQQPLVPRDTPFSPGDHDPPEHELRVLEGSGGDVSEQENDSNIPRLL